MLPLPSQKRFWKSGLSDNFSVSQFASSLFLEYNLQSLSKIIMASLAETKLSIIQQSLSSQIRCQIDKNKQMLLPINDNWTCYGSPIEAYEDEFKPVLDSENIVDLVKKKSSPVVIDLMAPSDTLASLFRKIPHKSKFGIALSYIDRRSTNKFKRDEKLGIKQLAGDILGVTTWKEIEETLNGRKADLIMERAIGGKMTITSNVRVHAVLLNRVWKLLSNDYGILLVEMPSCGNNFLLNNKIRNLSDWLSLLKEKEIGVVCAGNGTMKLTKTPNSPKELPFLE